MTFWGLTVREFSPKSLNPIERSFRIEKAICRHECKRANTMLLAGPVAIVIFAKSEIGEKPLGLTFRKGNSVKFSVDANGDESATIDLSGHYLDDEDNEKVENTVAAGSNKDPQQSESERLFAKRRRMEQDIMEGQPLQEVKDVLSKMAAAIESLRNEVQQSLRELKKEVTELKEEVTALKEK